MFDIYKTAGKILLQNARGLKKDVERGSSHRGLSAGSPLIQYNRIRDDNPTQAEVDRLERPRLQWKPYGPSQPGILLDKTVFYDLKSRAAKSRSGAQATGMVSSWLATFQIRVLV